MAGMLLTDDQISAGSLTLLNGKLQPSQVDDLISIWRSYLGTLASNYQLLTTLEALDDTGNTRKRAAKLAACLLLWQDNQFDVSGFAATAANKSGFNDSGPGENYEIFKYAFGLFWDIPVELEIKFNSNSSGGGSSKFSSGVFVRNLS